MIVTRLKLPLEQAEYSALLRVAGDELRNPIDQARFILRKELERLGFLVIETRIDLVTTCVDTLPTSGDKESV